MYILENGSNKSRQEVNWKRWLHGKTIIDWLYQTNKMYNDALEWALEWIIICEELVADLHLTKVFLVKIFTKTINISSLLRFASETLYIFYRRMSENIVLIMILQLNIYLVKQISWALAKLKSIHWIGL